MGTPDYVAAAVIFLASTDSAYLTGQIFNVDGGMTAQARAPQVEGTPITSPRNMKQVTPTLLP